MTSPRKRPDLLLPLFFLAVATAALWYVWPSARDLSIYYDWRYFETMAEISRRTVLWYRQVPLWNPYSCGGEVDLANPQSMAAAPTFLLVLLFGTALGEKLALLVYLFCAMDGTYRLALHLSTPRAGAVLSALSFGLCGYLALHLAAGHINFAGVCLYPYLLLFFDRTLPRADGPGQVEGQVEWLVPMALVLAWIALLGGTFTPPMAGVLLLSWATAHALERRSLRPFALLVLGGLLALVLGAVRMLPVLEFIHDHPRPAFRRSVDISSLPQVLSDLLTFREFGPLTGRKYWSHEYAAKLPYVLLPLFVLSFAAFFQRCNRTIIRRLWVLSLLFALLSMGNFAVVAPWSLLQRLPVLRDLRVPSRHLVLLCLVLSLLGGQGYALLAAWLKQRGRRARGLGLLLCGLCAVDGLLSFAPHFRPVFHSRLAVPVGPSPFYFIEGDWQTMREDVFAGHGTLHCDEEAPLQRAEALDPDNVPQERLLDPSAGEVIAARFSPCRREVTVDLQKDTLLLINSNWNEHWKSDRGRATQVAGRLSVDLSGLRGRQVVTLRYAPTSFTVGAVLSGLSLPLSLLYFVRRRRRSTGLY